MVEAVIYRVATVILASVPLMAKLLMVDICWELHVWATQVVFLSAYLSDGFVSSYASSLSNVKESTTMFINVDS